MQTSSNPTKNTPMLSWCGHALSPFLAPWRPLISITMALPLIDYHINESYGIQSFLRLAFFISFSIMPLRVIQVAVCMYSSSHLLLSIPLCVCTTVCLLHVLLSEEFQLGTVAGIGGQESDLSSFLLLSDNNDENNHGNTIIQPY